MAKIAKKAILGNSTPNFKASLDTLAQLGTGFYNRAKRKHLSTPLALRLVDASKQNPKSNLKKSYFNTYHCCRTLAIRDDGTVRGSYCKNRWCLVCNNIRTAQLINRYMPILDEWNDKYFVTLTIPNCKGKDLPCTIDLMQQTFNKIHAKLKKQFQRKQRDKIVGLRKLECTYNPTRNDYHPHYHLIINGKENATDILNEWLQRLPATKRKAQDLQMADSKASKELFKYFTKVVTTIKDKNGEVKDRKIYADAMDVIFNAIKGKRTFQNFGFKALKVESEDLDKPMEIERIIEEVEWVQELGDWAHSDGELFTGHIPSKSMTELVTKKIIVRTLFHGGQLSMFNSS